MEHTQHNSKVVIMYLLWDEEPKKYLADAMDGVVVQTYPHENIEFLIVYNSHAPGHESQAQYIIDEIEKNKHRLPHATVLPQEKNLGFSGANNLGMEWAMEHGFDYVFLHNGDGYLEARCMEKLIEAMDGDHTIGVAQSLILLDPEKHLINSSGNKFHYLGFGYCDAYRMEVAQTALPPVKDVGYASGAAVMMRTSLLKQYGFWDEDYFMYHEDTDYSLRMKMMGLRAVVVRDSLFYHKYQFSKSIQKYFWMERNRYAVLLIFLKWPTLLLLLPILIPLEVGLFLFSIKNGWWKEKLRMYVYWLQPHNWRPWLKKRTYMQSHRTITDKYFLKDVETGIYFQDKSVESPLLHIVANPVMKFYYNWIVKPLIRW